MSKSKAKPAKKKASKKKASKKKASKKKTSKKKTAKKKTSIEEDPNYLLWFNFNFVDPSVLLNPPPSMSRAQIQALYDSELARINQGTVEQLEAKYQWEVLDGHPQITNLKAFVTAIVDIHGRSDDGGGTPSAIPPTPPPPPPPSV